MPSKHKRNPLTVRLPAGERERLEDYAERTDQPVGRVIADAVREKLDREEGKERAARIREMSARVRGGELG